MLTQKIKPDKWWQFEYEQFTVKPIQASFSTVIIKVDKLRNKIYVYRKTIHSSTLAWKISRTEECCRLPFMGSQRVRHEWATKQLHIRESSVQYVLNHESLDRLNPNIFYWIFLPPCTTSLYKTRDDCKTKRKIYRYFLNKIKYIQGNLKCQAI